MVEKSIYLLELDGFPLQIMVVLVNIEHASLRRQKRF